MQGMDESEMFRVRKFSDIDSEWPIFEVLRDNKVIFDITFAKGRYEIAFHHSIAQEVMGLDLFNYLVNQCKTLLHSEGVLESVPKDMHQ